MTLTTRRLASADSARLALAERVKKRVALAGEYDHRIPSLHMAALTAPLENPNCFYVLSVGMILQGEKRLHIGKDIYDFKAGSTLVTSIDLPTSYEIENVSEASPFVSLSLRLNPATIAEILTEETAPQELSTPFSFEAATEELIEDFDRLLRLLDRPEQIAVRAPLIIRDIHYLALSGAGSEALRSLYAPGKTGHRIRMAVKWLRDNFRESVSVDDLAQIANMAPATFHRQFKALTSMSPMQYLKRLRLYEAQQFLLKGDGDVNSAAYAVGYMSAHQFNRDYKKLFGEPPGRSTKARREALLNVSDNDE